MTDNEIIKGLECCSSESCNGCPYSNRKCHQGNPMIRDALDLINRQKAEIERVKNAFENSQKTSKYWKSKCDELAEEVLTTKSEAIREFWNRRPPQLNPDIEGKEQYNKGWNACISEFAKDYKAFVKEMAGETGEM